MADDMNTSYSDDSPEQESLDTVPTDIPESEEVADEPENGSLATAEHTEEQVPTAAQAVGSFFSEGATAMREMSAARKAHAEAREELESLERTIEEEETELAHRQDVAANYASIIRDETARRDGARKTIAACETEQERIQAEIDRLKDELQQMKDADNQTEKRLKAALDAAEAREASARESGTRVQRRLDDAKKNLEKAEEDKKSGIEAARAAVESASQRLKMLREEFAEVQRNPSANSAAYSVRADELQTEISDAARELQEAKDDLPRITEELADALDHARKAVREAEKPMDAAKKAFREVNAAADDARNTYREARDDASERQRGMREQISAQEKAKREQEQRADDAREEELAAQALIDEANDIHAHPEETEALAARLEEDRIERASQAAEVEQLASTEKAVRERTRGPRTRFIGAIAGIVIAVAVIALIIIFVVM